MFLQEKTGCSFEEAKSTQKIWLLCDYCGSEFQKTKRHRIYSNSIIEKDSCGNKSCTTKKRNESTTLKHGENCFKEKFLDKARETNLEKLGVDNPAKSSFIKEKIEKTNIRKYGVKSYLQTKEKQIKSKITSKERYGTDHPAQSEIIKNKIIDTCMKNYGVMHHQQTNEWKEKIKIIVLEKYGVDNVMKSEEIKNKLKNILKEKYGVFYPLQNKNILNKMIITCNKRYGVDNYSQTKEYIEKYKETCIARYGVDHPMKYDEIKMKSLNKRLEIYGTLTPNLGKEQKNIENWINSLHPSFTFKPNIDILNGKEIDMFDEKLGIGVEYSGLLWHNELSLEPRDSKYHYNKYKNCLNKEIRLITIFEDEWILKNNQCKNMLKSILGVNAIKVMARKCMVKEVDKKIFKDFCEEYHLQGSNNLGLYFCGIYYKDELLGVMSIGKHHRKNDITLDRLCFKENVSVIGGANKLFSKCLEWVKLNGYKKIISWSDNRWSQGNIYKILGFKLDKILPPDYSYVDMKRKYTRISKQSQKKSNTNCPKDKTEREWAIQNNLGRIWDCGKIRWVYDFI